MAVTNTERGRMFRKEDLWRLGTLDEEPHWTSGNLNAKWKLMEVLEHWDLSKQVDIKTGALWKRGEDFFSPSIS